MEGEGVVAEAGAAECGVGGGGAVSGEPDGDSGEAGGSGAKTGYDSEAAGNGGKRAGRKRGRRNLHARIARQRVDEQGDRVSDGEAM